LGKFNITPPLDFDTDGQLEYQPVKKETPYVPRIDYNPNYNPFHYSTITPQDSDFEVSSPSQTYHKNPIPANWAILFDGLKEENEPVQTAIPEMEEVNPTLPLAPCHFQLKGRYIVTPVQMGLMLVDQKRAHERILYEKYLTDLECQQVVGQKALFPEILEVSMEDFILLNELLPDLGYLGFELNVFGKNCFAIQATPPDLSYHQAKKVLMELLEHYKVTEGSIREKAHERMALALAKAMAIGYNSNLSCEEMEHLTSQLFSCKIQNYTADGKTILHILKYEDVNGWFK
jgi:DNA mismatch repair protein MutL